MKKKKVKWKKSLADWKEEYEYYSSTASSIGRNLALVGIAVIWLFKVDSSDHLLPEELIWPLFLLVASICLDLVQNLAGAIIWYHFFDYHEKYSEKDHDNIKAPDLLPRIISSFFYLKMITLVLAYVLIMIYLFPML